MSFRLCGRVLLAASLGWAASIAAAQGAAPAANLDKAFKDPGNWYASWGYSRQQYAPSDIHVSQPSLGNNYTLHGVKAGDFPGTFSQTLESLGRLDWTSPQENVRIGRFLTPEKDFAIEFSLDHSKYNTNIGQTVRMTGTKNGAAVNTDVVLTGNTFTYNLHNGLNHIMVNGVWFKDLYGPKNQPGHLQFLSRAGVGVLLPHADNILDGNANSVGPKQVNVCCGKGDWWQLNGWTVGVELGFRYTFYRSMYLELTTKQAYGALRGVPVYQGTVRQKIWMMEEVLSTGFVF